MDRTVFIEAEKASQTLSLKGSDIPPWFTLDGLRGILPPPALKAELAQLQALNVDAYIQRVVHPSEHHRRRSAVDVIRHLGGEVLHEVREGPLYASEQTFRLPGGNQRRLLFLAQDRKVNNGIWTPKEHRRAVELLRFYSSYGTPLITFIDTPGADAGEEANRDNQAHSISLLISVMANFQLPSIGIIFGNAYSGGAIPLATTNLLFSVRDGIFNTIHPSGLSGIAYHYNLSWQECARYVRISAYELCHDGYIDGIIDYSPLEAKSNPAAAESLREAIFSGLERIEKNAASFINRDEHQYFFEHYRENVMRSLNPSELVLAENRLGRKTPSGLLNVFGSVYRFLRIVKLRQRLSSQSLRIYSRRSEGGNPPRGNLSDRLERERSKNFAQWWEQPLELRYHEALLRRYRKALETLKTLGQERIRLVRFFIGTPEEKHQKACQELTLELALYLYNFWKIQARHHLLLLLGRLQQESPPSQPTASQPAATQPAVPQPPSLQSPSPQEANILDALRLEGVRKHFPRMVRNLVLFDLLYDKLMENLPSVAQELRQENRISQDSMESLLEKVFEEARQAFETLSPPSPTESTPDTTPLPTTPPTTTPPATATAEPPAQEPPKPIPTSTDRDFFAWLEEVLSRQDVEKLILQVSEWKRTAFPRLSEPLFRLTAYYFTDLLPSIYAAWRDEKSFDGRIKPRHIGIKDFWNRLNQAYRDLLIFNQLEEAKREHPLTPQKLIETFFSEFFELDEELISANPVHFPGFQQAIDKALAQSVTPCGLVTGIATFHHADITARVGVAVSNARFQSGAFDMASGEKLCRLLVECADKKLPLVMLINSGGMQTKEGAGALFSMAVLNARLNRFIRDYDLPVLCFGLRDCTGGAQASFVTHNLVKTYYLSGAVMPFAGKRVTPAYLPAESIVANYLSLVPGSMDGLVENPFDPHLDRALAEIDPNIPLPSESAAEVIARILRGEYAAQPPSEKDDPPLGFISFAPVRKMLIHARGATAVRLVEAAHKMGIRVVLVQSDPDMQSAAAQMLEQGDELVSIGGNTPQQSYLNPGSVITLAALHQVDAIHPGIGFFSENPSFAHLCRKHGYNFIGPRAQSMELMGNKSNAIATTKNLGVPVVPGSDGVVSHLEEAVEIAGEIGYPVLIKSAFGGGGKGIRIARDEETLRQAFRETTTEAESAFGNGDLYLERFVDSARHIEVQVLRDRQGVTRVLGLRDCSIQRQNQKLIEESGAQMLSQAQIEAITADATRLADAIDYIGAGTVEFIYDRQAQAFHFMEMNTRLQVEHVVTEAVCGVDIVAEQIRIAAGESIAELPQKTEQGHAMELRINAERLVHTAGEDPQFIPSPGRVTRLKLPWHEGIRILAAVREGDSIPPYYDSLIVQLVAHAETRAAVIDLLRGYLQEVHIEGVYTNLALFEAILEDEVFRSGNYDTGFIPAFMTRTSLSKLIERQQERNPQRKAANNPETDDLATKDPETEGPSGEMRVFSPRSGVFYTRPAPEEAPFLRPGQTLDAHTPLCLVEAMKNFQKLTLADCNPNDDPLRFDPARRFQLTRLLFEDGQTIHEGDLVLVVKPLSA